MIKWISAFKMVNKFIPKNKKVYIELNSVKLLTNVYKCCKIIWYENLSILVSAPIVLGAV